MSAGTEKTTTKKKKKLGATENPRAREVTPPRREVDWEELVAAAKEARDRAHAPYSKYQVGAALLGRGGGIFAGCNVENASYGATLCAERAAVAQMIAAGEKHPVACVVVTRADAQGEPGAPCGICRQVLREFATDMPVLLVGVRGTRKDVQREVRLGALLPGAFTFER